MIFLRIFVLTLIFIAVACDDSNNREQVIVEQKKHIPETLSMKTEITSSASEIVKISIPTAVCKMCENNIKSVLTELDGVINQDINIQRKSAEVLYDPAVTTAVIIRQAISDAGYDADDVKRNLNAYQKLDECCKIESNIHS